MKISKTDALMWFEFFAQLPEGEQLSVRQQEIVYAVFAQIEDAVDARREKLMAQIASLTEDCDATAVEAQQEKTRAIMKKLPLADLTTDAFGDYLGELYRCDLGGALGAHQKLIEHIKTIYEMERITLKSVF